MSKPTALYETYDTTVWRVTDDEGTEHWETRVGIQRVLRFDRETEALAHVRQWESEARHDRSYQAMSSASIRPRTPCR